MGQFNKDIEEKVKRREKILFEDDKIAFIQCTDLIVLEYYTPSCKYRAVKSMWDADRDSELYFILNKENKFVDSISLSTDKTLTIFNDCEEVSFDKIVDEYPQLKNFLYETFAVTDTYETLKRIKEGFQYDSYQLRRIDDSFYDIIFNKNNPSKSMIKLKFNYEEYIKLFYKKEDYDNWGAVDMILRLNDGYYDYQFNDYSTIQEDWRQGYLTFNFDDENLKKLFEIGKFFFPGEYHGDILPTRAEGFSMICEKLESIFNKQVDWIIDEFYSLDEEARKQGVLEDVNSSFSNVFDHFGIFNPSNNISSKFVTTVQTLIKLYDRYKMKGFSIYQLLKQIVSDNDLWGSEYQENYYDYYGDFDKVSFNKVVKTQLDDILEKIEDDETFSNIDEYREILNAISKYGIDKWNFIKNRNVRFMVKDVNTNTNMITVLVRNDKTATVESRSYDLEGFNNFLHSPEIFEQKL